MSLSLDLLRSFLAVHRAGSITAAADRLGLAQPTVTARVRALERQLGRPLFDRMPRGVVPTAAADELARRIAEPLDALEAALLDEPSAPYPTTVHLGGPPDVLCARALPVLADLVADGLQLRVTFGMPEEVLPAAAAGRLDLAITGTRPRQRGLVTSVLCDEEFVLVAAPVWAERTAAPVGPETLRPVPLVAYAEEAPLLRRYWRTVFGERLTRTPDLVVPDLRGVLSAVLAGAGASVLPTYLCADPLATGALRSLMTPELPPVNTLYLAGRPAALARRAVAAVHDRLRQGLTA